jgi:5-methyltetrahydropteroyltriglutamate--homocysteine methyltransferase
MSIATTCIGAYPKPDFVALPDWFNLPAGPDTSDPTRHWEAAMAALGSDAEAVLTRGVKQAVEDQLQVGIDIPTDGEIPRENYIHYHCRHLNGFDFDCLTEKELRGGTYSAQLPTIVGPVSVKKEFMVNEWKRAQQFTDKPVKVTMPGPMTVTDTNANAYYQNPKELGSDIAMALNKEVKALAAAGCRHIQIDEPLFARKPEQALEFGFDNLEKAFHGCPKHVTRTVHMCCGYPDRLDHPDYPKADQDAYHQLVDAVDYALIDAVSFEDAHRPNDLKLLEGLTKTTAILGVVAIAKSRIETADEIEARLRAALQHIDRERLIAAPDCGLGLLSREQAMAKLKVLCAAAERV